MRFLLPLAALAGCSSSPTPPSVPEADLELSVMSFNVRWDNPEDEENGWPHRRDAVADLLDDHAPDIVGFQETQHHMVVELEEDMPAYTRIGVGRDDGEEAGEYAAIFFKTDRFDVVEWGTFWLSETPEEVGSIGWDANIPRIVTWAELDRLDDDREESVWVFNTHFDHQGSEAREQSALLLRERIEDQAGLDVPVFVTGDFNAPLRNDLFDPLLEILFDAREAPVTDDETTFNGFGHWTAPFVGAIDFVFYRNAEALRFDTIHEDYGVRWVSDHYPVFAEFRY